MDSPPMYIDPHVHMISRTTDDYEAMRDAGVVAVIEPAFWVGQPRTNVGAFQHYFGWIVGWERFRAGQFGIRHYCTIGLNAKEANNEPLAEEVMDLLPLYLNKEGVVAIGEIGFDDMTDAEEKYFHRQLELAKELDKLVLVHTPHRNKTEGTSRSMDLCEEHELDPAKVIIDHNTEETVQEVLDRGFWAAFSIYPETKMGNERMADLVEQYGPERLIVDSAADWGVSDPLAVPKTAQVMQQRDLPEQAIRQVTYENALAAYGQSDALNEDDWLNPSPVDQRQNYEGNSVLRGGREPVVEDPDRTIEDDVIIE